MEIVFSSAVLLVDVAKMDNNVTTTPKANPLARLLHTMVAGLLVIVCRCSSEVDSDVVMFWDGNQWQNDGSMNSHCFPIWIKKIRDGSLIDDANTMFW